MTVSTWYNDRQIINAIKTSLQTNLEDPRLQYVTDARSWVHTDEPRADATYPRIYIKKSGPTQTKIIDIGQDFVEWRAMVLEIHFKTKTPFKYKLSDNTYIQDEELVKEYLDKIWQKLKAAQSTLHTNYGITGLKPLDDEDPYQEPDSQLFSGNIRIRVWYFRKTQP